MTVTERGNGQKPRLGIAREFNNYGEPNNCGDSFVVVKCQSGKGWSFVCVSLLSLFVGVVMMWL